MFSAGGRARMLRLQPWLAPALPCHAVCGLPGAVSVVETESEACFCPAMACSVLAARGRVRTMRLQCRLAGWHARMPRWE